MLSGVSYNLLLLFALVLLAVCTLQYGKVYGKHEHIVLSITNS